MKLKQIKLKRSSVLLSDEEMKNVIGGSGLDPIPESGKCYVGYCVGVYTYKEVAGGFQLVCDTPYTDCDKQP